MNKTGFNQEIAEQAADWAVRLDAGELSAAERRDLADWLSASPVHIDEFLLASATISGLSNLDADRQVDLDELLASSSAEVVSLEKPQSHAAPESRRVSSVLKIAAAALVSLAAVSWIGVMLWSQDVPEQTAPSIGEWYETGLGEQRSIQLEDGSLVHINTQSRLQVVFNDAERRVDLLSGEAMFDVEHDPDRPFRVWAGGTVAEALGTVFNVRVDDETAIVSVVEGVVKVDQRAELEALVPEREAEPILAADPSIAPPRDNVILSVGDSASVQSTENAVTIDKQSIEAITSWRERKLVFEAERLDQIAAEFNRYNRTQLVVDDSELAAVKFTGVFDADDPDSFVKFLEFAGGVKAAQTGRDIHLDRASAR